MSPYFARLSIMSVQHVCDKMAPRAFSLRSQKHCFLRNISFRTERFLAQIFYERRKGSASQGEWKHSFQKNTAFSVIQRLLVSSQIIPTVHDCCFWRKYVKQYHHFSFVFLVFFNRSYCTMASSNKYWLNFTFACNNLTFTCNNFRHLFIHSTDDRYGKKSALRLLYHRLFMLPKDFAFVIRYLSQRNLSILVVVEFAQESVLQKLHFLIGDNLLYTNIFSLGLPHKVNPQTPRPTTVELM